MSEWGFQFHGGLMWSEQAAFVSSPATSGSNTKTAWQQLTASLARPVHLIEIVAFGANDSGGNLLHDVGIGASGSETVVVPNIPVNNNTNGCPIYGRRGLRLPVQWAAGSRIAVRWQSAFSGKSGYLNVHYYTGSHFGQAAPSGSNIQHYGASTASSALTFLSNSAYTQMTASTVGEHKGIYLVHHPHAGFVDESYNLSVAIGGAGAEQVIYGPLALLIRSPTWTTYYGNQSQFIHIPVRIPAGTRLSIFKGTTTSQIYASIIGY